MREGRGGGCSWVSVPAGKLLGLDQAVHLSIDCAGEGREGWGVLVGECSSWGWTRQCTSASTVLVREGRGGGGGACW